MIACSSSRSILTWLGNGWLLTTAIRGGICSSRHGGAAQSGGFWVWRVQGTGGTEKKQSLPNWSRKDKMDTTLDLFFSCSWAVLLTLFSLPTS